MRVLSEAVRKGEEQEEMGTLHTIFKKPRQGRTKRLPVAPIETKNARDFPPPTSPELENHQLNLFQEFLCNTLEERNRLSNVIDLWDNVPRYGISRKAMTDARVNDTFLKEHETEFQYKGRTFRRILFPAKVKDDSGVYRDYYPSANEELIEDALRKLAAEQYSGYFDNGNHRSGIIFTLYMLQEELKNRGHARSYQEIVLALNILSGSIIEISAQHTGKRLRSDQPIFPRWRWSQKAAGVVIQRPDGWCNFIHWLRPASTKSLTGFNYHVMMGHRTQLARWLHKQLALKYTFAGLTNPYEIRFSTIKRDSGLLENYGRDRRAIDEVTKAFKELKEHSVLADFKRADVLGPRGKISDVVFTLMPSMDFIRDTKAGNKRLQMATGTSPPKPLGIRGG
jgi:hypothetical protein